MKNVLSLFNGMSCLQIALSELGITYDNYYSSEIDKHAIKANMAMFPDTIQLGDITKWREWDIDWSTIDLIGAGSPCQGFSFAGKGLNFNDERSKLFFVFVEILNHVKKHNPDVLFLLENVRMKKEHEIVITRYTGVNPIMINSALLSAQNRVRLYWCNINEKPYGLFGDMFSDIPQPKDKGIFLKDILESEVDGKYFLTQKALDYVTNEERINKGYTSIDGNKGLSLNAVGTWNNTGTLITESINNEKSTTIDGSYYKGFGVRSNKCRQVAREFDGLDINKKERTLRSGGKSSQDDKHNYDLVKIDKQGNVKNNQDKAGCLCGGGHSGGNHSDMDLIQIGNIYDNDSNSAAGRVYSDNGKSVTLKSEGGGGGAKTGLYQISDRSIKQISNNNKSNNGTQPYQQDRIYDINGISPALNSQLSTGGNKINTSRIRRLTPRECFRLQTVPEHFIDILLNSGISDTQLYKICGNGWTVEVIKHILSFIQ